MDPRRLVTGAAEIRAAEDGVRRLTGTAIQEGRAAGDRGELFAPGSITWPAEGMGVALAHRAAPEVRATTTRQGNGEITIEARATPRMVEAYEAGRRALSIEFHSLAETRKGGNVREITSAFVPLVAMVPVGAYNEASVEVRRALGMSGSMRMGAAVDCRCGPGDCDSALVAEVEVSASDLLGYLGDYSKPLGSASAKVEGGRLVTEIAVATGVSYADDLVAMIRAGVSPVIRPYPDAAKSRTRKEGRVLVYDLLSIAGLIVTFTDQTQGFEAATLSDEAENRKGLVGVAPSGASEAILRGFPRRRIWL